MPVKLSEKLDAAREQSMAEHKDFADWNRWRKTARGNYVRMWDGYRVTVYRLCKFVTIDNEVRGEAWKFVYADPESDAPPSYSEGVYVSPEGALEGAAHALQVGDVIVGSN